MWTRKPYWEIEGMMGADEQAAKQFNVIAGDPVEIEMLSETAATIRWNIEDKQLAYQAARNLIAAGLKNVIVSGQDGKATCDDCGEPISSLQARVEEDPESGIDYDDPTYLNPDVPNLGVTGQLHWRCIEFCHKCAEPESAKLLAKQGECRECWKKPRLVMS